MGNQALIRVQNTHRNDDLIRQMCDDDRYIIRSNGKVESLVQRTGRISANGTFRVVKPYKDISGYLRMKYCYKDLFIHRIVFQKFVADLDPALVINHIDGNPSNNDFKNLEQVTHKKNMDHLIDLMKKQNSSPVAKHVGFLGAQRIRKDYAAGLTREQLSEKYKISIPSIRSILMNKSYGVQNG